MKKSNLLFILSFALLLINSCSYKIIERQFEGKSIAREGDTINICWKFDKADYVVVEGVQNHFAPNECYSIVAKENKKLNITAINYFDTLSKVWDIIIKDRIKTGLFDNLSETSKSFNSSNYFSGIDLDGLNSAKQLKVTSFKVENKKINVDFIILDEFGNFISNYDTRKLSVSTESQNVDVDSIYQVENNQNDVNKLYFFIDNSFPSDNLDYYFTGISNLLNQLQDYEVTVVIYNHKNLTELKFPSDNYDDNLIPNEKGLNNLYFTLYHYLANIFNSENENVLIINLLFSGDNSSLVVDAKDVASLAREKRCKIYNIIPGDEASTHSFLYLSQFTGGRLYFTEKGNRDEVISAIKEILYSQSYHYSANFSYDINSNAKFFVKTEDNNNVQDAFSVYAEPEDQYSDNQILALFDYRSAELLESYTNNLDILAEIAINNPNYTLEIIGYAEFEGKESDTKNLAQYRAQIVADKLIALGVSASQIRVVSEGSSKPIYYLPSKDWQKLYNRRVEIRWITPDDLPYEIIENIYPSEEIAQNKVDFWKERGYKSYYERSLKNNKPYYKVKLWGYATAEEAEKVKKILSKKYKSNFQVR